MNPFSIHTIRRMAFLLNHFTSASSPTPCPPPRHLSLSILNVLFILLPSGGPHANHPHPLPATTRPRLAHHHRLSPHRSGLLRALVLAAPSLARLPNQQHRPRRLALARRHSLRSRLCRRPPLHLGFRPHRSRHTRTHRSPAKIGCRWFLPLCAQSHVCGIFRRLARPLDRLRPRQRHG